MVHLLTEKHSSWGRSLRINILRLLEWFLKNDPMAINPGAISLRGFLFILFTPQRMAKFLNNGRITSRRMRDPYWCQD